MHKVIFKKSVMFFLVLAMLCGIVPGLEFGMGVAYAVVTNFSADVTAEQLYHRPWTPGDHTMNDADWSRTWFTADISTANDLIAHPPTADNYNYITRELTPSQTSSYTITVNSATGLLTSGKNDTQIWIYQNSFNPSSPLTNVLAVNEDIDYILDSTGKWEDGNWLSEISNITLNEGVKYILLVTTYTAGQTGTVNFSATGSGSVSVSDPLNPTYTVTYNGNGSTGGSVPTDGSSYVQGASVTVLGNTGNLVRTGYTFAGWNTAANGSGTDRAATSTFNMGSTNVTLYAKWTANPSYTVTYNGNGSTGGSVPADGSSYVQGASVTVLGNTGNLVRTGYTFTGWNTAADGSGTARAAASTLNMGNTNVTLYAKWINLGPTGTITINGGNDLTNSTTVFFVLSASDPEGDAVTHMCFSNDDVNWTTWEAYATTKAYTLPSGDGSKTVYVKFKDSVGSIGVSGSDSIELDTTPPNITGVANNTAYNIDVTPSFTEGTATLAKDGGSANAYTSGTTISVEGNYILVLTDTAGNITTVSFTIDKTVPTGTISINDGDANTTSTSVTLTVTRADGSGIGVAQMRFSNDGSTWSTWENAAASKAWTIPSTYGTATVYMQLKDNAGNISGNITDTIQYKSVPISSDSTKNGTEDSNVQLSVTDFVYSNADGSQMNKIMVVSLPSHGSLKLGNTNVSVSQEVYATDLGKLVFIPDGNWNGTTSFIWKGSDGVNYSSQTATITINIAAANDAPVASNGNLTTNADTAGSGTLSASDIDGDSLTYSIVAQGSKGTATITNTVTGAYTYTPSYGTHGSDSFTFKVNDGSTDSNTATVTVNIIPSGAADLLALSVNAGTVTPAYAVNTMDYSVSVGNSVSTLTVTASVYNVHSTVKINGVSVTDEVYGVYNKTVNLNVGVNTIPVEVTAQDGVTKKTYTFTIYRSDGGSSGGSNPTQEKQDTTSTGVDVLVNGKVENAGTATTTKEGEKTVTTVTVDEKKLEQKLEMEGNKAIVTIPVNTKADVVVGELNGQMVKKMENKQAVLEVKTETAAYTLPAQQINIDAISDQIGKNVELKDIKVQIEIAKSTNETVKVVENSAKKGEFTIVAPPVDFTVKCTNDNKTVEVSKFNAYVERTVLIPHGVDPSKITTGIVVEPDGTVRHVPTKVIVIDGKNYAKINSLTNSTYSVVWHPLEFKDAEKHWAKEAINDMGSRMVISGVGNDMFEPGKDITRAEFAAIVVRALGLKPGTGNNSYTDVKDTDWYCDYIKSATEYKIISGYGNGKFGPMDKITREQAMTMIARAMSITGLKVEFKADEAEKLLSGFGDAGKSAIYAKNSIAACVKNGIVSGRSRNLIVPKDNITRAEVAAIARRLLQKSNLI